MTTSDNNSFDALPPGGPCGTPWCRSDHLWHSKKRDTDGDPLVVLVGEGKGIYLSARDAFVVNGAELRKLGEAILKHGPKARKRKEASRG